MRTLPHDVELSPTEADAVDVEFAISGDTQAFERLYRRHVGRMQGLARWLLGHDDVEDVLQEIFLRVWEKLHTFKGQAAFRTWLHRLATNVILRRREERSTRQNRHSGTELELDRTPGDRMTPELKVDIEAAVGRLPEKAREVFVLHDMAGYKHDEIGTMLGISAGTSRSQLHHARMALRAYFEA
ncbi:MAG: sigma-70 family RNA polymerase sigma factor [Gemmatimonadales bacterium]|nr:sigma-70 family RNA polymerase sigma factor [Gemmatimonadales bacterium]NIN11906.1 sigma-70 family RNA polymerase sigma factor [Gemmatimonadales bacterium]NIN50456.1 sigma-70 family RNA polymerase sigma factor [Gemmatimonadales bacterium]NIP07920.1 sigma-70 family RNA polymerase sigma factor [Gemmatimonadales bacterium]NIR01944.1 sigma-70 family RNA polymerase sigma factor [Gemmatimonadales bacterium]